MGQYTAHWNAYRDATRRQTLQLLGVLVLLPVIAGTGLLLSRAGVDALPLSGVLLVAWLVLFIALALRSAKVTCPRCGTGYSRGKFLVNCPSCGLRMLQDDP